MVAEKSELNVFLTPKPVYNPFWTKIHRNTLGTMINLFIAKKTKKNHPKNRNQPETKTQPELRFFSPQILKVKIT
jgi:hypothetical protein